MTANDTDSATPRPVILPANQPRQFYRGGRGIAMLRGTPSADGFRPEDWVASTTTRFGRESDGLSLLPDGKSLRTEVESSPKQWLGGAHVARFGSSTALLVKLLDAGQRLPVHCHPSDSFAREHLGSAFGKTEAWVVIGTSAPDPTVHLGFRQDVEPDAVEHWVSTQDTHAMLGALNEFRVRPGDTVHVPAGIPHSIGRGVFVVELQQPTDLSVTLEWDGFLSGAENAFLGMDVPTALRCLNRDGLGAAEMSTLVRSTAELRAPRVPLLSEQAAPFFHADRLHVEPGADVHLAPGFGVLLVLSGSAHLHADDGTRLDLQRGRTVVIPHCAGEIRIDGDCTAVHCSPPR